MIANEPMVIDPPFSCRKGWGIQDEGWGVGVLQQPAFVSQVLLRFTL